MKTKMMILAAAFSSGFAFLGAQDAPKPPPGDAAAGRPPGGDPRAMFEETFKKMDANGDGKVSKEEFVEYRKKEAEDQFGKLDASNTGTVDKAQMEEAFQKLRAARGAASGRGGPDGFRRPEGGTPGPGDNAKRPDGFRPQGGPGGDGGVRQRPGGDGATPPPPGEGSAGGNPGGNPGGGRGMMGGAGGMGELYKKIMENGSVTKEEFTKISDEQFKKLDTNNDGKITKEELEESMRKLREQFGNRGGQPGGAPRPEGGEKPKRPEAN